MCNLTSSLALYHVYVHLHKIIHTNHSNNHAGLLCEHCDKFDSIEGQSGQGNTRAYYTGSIHCQRACNGSLTLLLTVVKGHNQLIDQYRTVMMTLAELVKQVEDEYHFLILCPLCATIICLRLQLFLKYYKLVSNFETSSDMHIGHIDAFHTWCTF